MRIFLLHTSMHTLYPYINTRIVTSLCIFLGSYFRVLVSIRVTLWFLGCLKLPILRMENREYVWSMFYRSNEVLFATDIHQWFSWWSLNKFPCFHLLDEFIPFSSSESESIHSIFHAYFLTFLHVSEVLVELRVFKYIFYMKCFLDPSKYLFLGNIVCPELLYKLTIINMGTVIFDEWTQFFSIHKWHSTCYDIPIILIGYSCCKSGSDIC